METSTTPQSDTKKQRSITGLRAAAELIESHPDLPLPFVCVYTTGNVDITWQVMNNDETKGDQRAAVLAIRRAIGGRWTKNIWDDRFDLEQRRDGLTLGIYSQRDKVCERVVTGTESVVIPAVEAQPERVEVIETVEWRCDPLLADETAVSA